MTFEQLLRRFPDATRETWHTHPNGGGWVENTARVDDATFVAEDAIIGRDARIERSEIWGGEIRGGVIWGGVIWGGEIRGGVIRGGVIWGGEIWGGVIWGGEIWGGEIRGGVIWGGEIRGGVIWGGVIWGGEWKSSPLFIQGTRHVVCVSEPGILSIGCMRHPIDWWRENYRDVGRKEGYAPQEIEEYGLYIELAARWMEIHGAPAAIERTAEASQ